MQHIFLFMSVSAYGNDRLSDLRDFIGHKPPKQPPENLSAARQTAWDRGEANKKRLFRRNTTGSYALFLFTFPD